jgi:hypothetical protein
MKKSLIASILTFVSVATFGQMVHYEVIKGSKKLGDMTVKRTLEENAVRYDISSEVTFRILFSFTVDYLSYSEYKHGKLIKEYTINKLNGSTQKESTIWYDGKKYTLDLDGVRTTLSPPISYSVASIYFQEPKDGQKVFSPQFGAFLVFKKIGEHTYEMESPDGINVYTYTNGICSRVNVNRDFAKFSFVMTPESLLAVKQKKIVGGTTTSVD